MSKSISADTIIGPYRVVRIVSKIHAGGMGDVYLRDSRCIPQALN